MKRAIHQNSIKEKNYEKSLKIQKRIIEWELIHNDSKITVLLMMDFRCLVKCIGISRWFRKEIMSIVFLKKWTLRHISKEKDVFPEETDPKEMIKHISHYDLITKNGPYKIKSLEIPTEFFLQEKKYRNIDMKCLVELNIQSMSLPSDFFSICFHKTQPFCLVQMVSPLEEPQIMGHGRNNLRSAVCSLFHREKEIACFEIENIRGMRIKTTTSPIDGYLFACFSMKNSIRIIAVPIENPLSYLYIDIKCDFSRARFRCCGNFIYVYQIPMGIIGVFVDSFWVFTLQDFVAKDKESVNTKPLLSQIVWTSVFSAGEKYLLIDMHRTKDIIMVIWNREENSYDMKKFEKMDTLCCIDFSLINKVFIWTFKNGMYKIPEKEFNSIKEFDLERDCVFTSIDMAVGTYYTNFRNDINELVCVDSKNTSISFTKEKEILKIPLLEEFKTESFGSRIVLFSQPKKLRYSLVDFKTMRSNNFSNDSLFDPKKFRPLDEKAIILFCSTTVCYAIGANGRLCFLDFLCKRDKID